MQADRDIVGWQRRFLLLGVVVPLVSVIALHLLMSLIVEPRWPQHTVVFGWVVGAIGLVAFALAMIWVIDRGREAMQAQNTARLEAERRLAVVEERERIAREMHDSLAQVLGASHLRLRAAQAAPELSPETRTELGDIAEGCHEAYADVREAILGLREGSRADRTFMDSLRAYLRGFQHRSGIETLFVNESDDDPALDPTVEVQVIRVIQEALTNVRKHAGARHAVVELTRTGGGVRFLVTDDGRGFVPGASTLSSDGGYGLPTMRERTEMVGGELSIESEPGRGTRVVIDLPSKPQKIGGDA